MSNTFKILYVGDSTPSGNSFARALALRRLGHQVEIVDPITPIKGLPGLGGFSTRFGFYVFYLILLRHLRRETVHLNPELVWINEGAHVPPAFIRELSKKGLPIVYYSTDDPYGQRDGRKWDFLKRSARDALLHVVVRKENVDEARAVGFPEVRRVYRSFDPVLHAPVELSDYDVQIWSSEVSFIGTWFPERGPFMVELLRLGVPLTIRGNRWQHSPEWKKLKHAWKGPGVEKENYVKAIQASKISLGLLSKANRDLHTTRSAEVPNIGSVFCAERTPEHEWMFTDGEDAVLWSTPAECAERCFELLDNSAKREQIITAAKKRIVELKLSNDDVLSSVISSLPAMAKQHGLHLC